MMYGRPFSFPRAPIPIEVKLHNGQWCWRIGIFWRPLGCINDVIHIAAERGGLGRKV
jgi:hypothetical protein